MGATLFGHAPLIDHSVEMPIDQRRITSRSSLSK
jgi:hypothetical protein